MALLGVNNGGGGGVGHVSDGADTLALNSYIGTKMSCAGAIQYVGVTNQQVVNHLNLLVAGGCRHRDGHRG